LVKNEKFDAQRRFGLSFNRIGRRRKVKRWKSEKVEK
jgi:hypothetical protein